MLKGLFILFLSFWLTKLAIGQTDKLILTESQNNEWLDSVSNSSLTRKLSLISERLLMDTMVFVKKTYSDVIRGDNQKGNKIEGNGKPILLIDGDYYIIENYTKSEEIIKLTKLLVPKNVKLIDVLKAGDGQSTALFGPVGENGAIIITLSNKKIRKQFSKVKI